MKLIVGLGNPGKMYKNNRHNVGHMFVDYLIKCHPERSEGSLANASSNKLRDSSPLAQNDINFVKTSVFMNQSGQEVRELIKNFKLEIKNLIVAHDDLDIPLGKFKIQFAQGPQLHNGIKSIENKLMNEKFWRIRIGVDNRKPEKWIDGETYVLSDFTKEEKVTLTNVFTGISKSLKIAISVNLRG